jgi:RimJ/RimL family protein N-acetyltransferase
MIRCWNPADAAMLQDTMNDNIEHLSTFLPWAANEPEDIQKKVDRLRLFRGNFDLGTDFVYGIFNPEETRVLGGSGLHTRVGRDAREIGYWIHKDFTHQGLATEISAALTRVAFEIDQIARVEIHCVVENVYSAAVPRKLGFTHEASLRKRVQLLEGHQHDLMVWTLLRDEYPHSPAAQAEITAFDALGRQII